jgi:hypothetical protein
MLLNLIRSYFNFFTPGIIQNSSAPKPPDYKGAAEATAASNLEAIKVQTAANRPTLVTPFGTQSWTNSRPFDQAGYDAAMADYNAKMSQATGPTQRWVPGGGSGGDNDLYTPGYWETVPGNSSNIAMPDREKFYGADQWTQTTTLTPEAQAALDAQMKIQQGRSDAALGLMPQMQKAINTPIDKDALQDWGAAPSTSNFQTVGQAEALSRMGNAPMLNQMGSSPVMGKVGAAPTLQTMLNLNGIPAMPGDANEAFVQKYVNKANEFARPQNELNQSNLDAKLFNMGLTPGSRAWVNAQRELADQRSRNEFNAINTGMNQSNQMYVNQLAANNQGFNQALGAGNFTNNALYNQNQMNLANQGFNNQADLNTFQSELAKLGFNNQSLMGQNQMQLQNQGFNNNAIYNENQMNLANSGFNNNVANTLFNQQMAQSNYANQLRQAQWTMAQQEQLQPLNVMNALLNGQQVTMPQMPSFSQQGNAGGVNYLGAANMQYQADLGAANAQNAAGNNMMSGLFSLGSSAIGGPAGGVIANGLSRAFGF